MLHGVNVTRHAAPLVLLLALAAGCSNSADTSSTASGSAAATQTAATAATAAPFTAQPTAKAADVPTAAVTPPPASADQADALAEGDLSADWLEPVELAQPVALENAVTVAIGELTSRHLDAALPDEVSGDGVIVPVTVANTGADELSLAGLVVTVAAGEENAPASQMLSASDQIPASLAPGRAVTIDMAFVIPEELRGNISIVVDLGAQSRAAVFQGAAPTS